MKTRPTRAAAENAVRAFLNESELGEAEFTLVEDGETGWAFYLLKDDTTSYVHEDLSIEWYGTGWEPGEREEHDADCFCVECMGGPGDAAEPDDGVLDPAGDDGYDSDYEDNP